MALTTANVSGQYQPLVGPGAFRLLQLQAGRADDQIRCELMCTTLGNAHDNFEAISYTWGAPADPATIICNDLPLHVQQNAYALLHQLRPVSGPPRLLWVDAICIKQQDPAERASQVMMMDDIYRRAKMVTIWLGPADESSRAAVQYAATLDPQALRQQLHTATMQDVSAFESAKAMANKSFFFDDFDNSISSQAQMQSTAANIGTFLLRPYFRRVWIQQEVRLAREIQVYCGADRFGWDAVWTLAWIMNPRSPGAYPGFADKMYVKLMGSIAALTYIEVYRVRSTLIAGSHNRTHHPRLFEQLDTYRSLEATDPRDKVYALLNLAVDSTIWVPQVDYEIPWQLLYLSIARDGLACGDMTILESAGRARQEPGASVVPSWMPDFRSERESDYVLQKHPQWRPDVLVLPNSERSKKELLAAPVWTVRPLPRRMRRKVRIPDDIRAYPGPAKALFQSYLTARRYMSDEIVYIGKQYDRLRTTTTMPGEIGVAVTAEADAEHVRSLPWTHYLSGERSFDAFQLTCMLGRSGARSGWREVVRDAEDVAEGAAKIGDNWEEWIAWLCKGKLEEEGDIVETDSKDTRPALFDAAASSQYAYHFRFATTRNGYFCLVPGIAEVGDHIAVISRYTMPIVIRPFSQSVSDTDSAKTPGKKRPPGPDLDLHEFIGDAYVHGAMESELHNIMGVYTCMHNPTTSQKAKLQAELDDEEYNGWRMLDMSSHYERILCTLGMRDLHIA